MAESFSVPEATDRDDFYAIRTSVGHVRSGENEQEIGLPERNLPLGFVVFPDKIPEFKQMRGTSLDFAGKDGTSESQVKCEELRIISGKICPVSLVIFEVFGKRDGRKRPRRGGVAIFQGEGGDEVAALLWLRKLA